MTDEIPDWLTVGAEVAVITHRGPSTTAGIRTVKSIGKRYIVLDNGTRFDRTRGDLSRYESGPFGVYAQLVASDHPKVIELQATRRRSLTADRVTKLLNEWRRDGDVTILRAAIDGLSKHLPSDGAA